MSDFASAAMIRVLLSGMKRLGMQAPPTEVQKSARIPLDAKRTLLHVVQSQLGIGALLKLGQGVQDNLGDSLFPILIHPGKPLTVLNAWLRLERYIHSKHRIQQSILTPNSVRHEHLGLSNDSPPFAHEDLVVIGVIVALLEQSSCAGVTVTLQNGLKVWPLTQSKPFESSLEAASKNGHTNVWTMTWRQPEQAATSKDFRAISSNRLASSQSLAEKSQSTPEERAVRASLDHLDEQAVSILSVAHAMQTSPRSLQRKLKEEGKRFADIVGNYRAEHAARLLAYSRESLSHIGFAAGYSDQAHFSRDFSRRVGLRPQQYREHAIQPQTIAKNR
jgi:AraC-like DNA-binding protein